MPRLAPQPSRARAERLLMTTSTSGGSGTSTTPATSPTTSPFGVAGARAPGSHVGGAVRAGRQAVVGAAFADLIGGRRSAAGGAGAGPSMPRAAGACNAAHGGEAAPALGGHGRRDAASDEGAARDALDARADDRKLDALAEGCDAMARHAAHMGLPAGFGLVAHPAPADAGASHATARARTSIEDLLPSLVRRIAWSGDGKRGTVRMELGAGVLEGSTVLIQADAGRVRVELSTPPGTDASAWRERILARLRERGVDVESVEVY